MHMADALLSPAVAAAMYAATAGATGASIHRLRKDEDFSRLPTMAVSAALVFAGQMINYTIPGTGSSGHICGGMLLSALLGPYAGFLSMLVILSIQCLFFADGGLMALGANCWNMAFYGCFAGYYLIWRPVVGGWKKCRGSKKMRLRIALASALGCIITLQMGAFSVVLETSLSGITELPLRAFVTLMQPIHLVIGLVEGLVTAAVLIFVYESRPEMVQCASGTSPDVSATTANSSVTVSSQGISSASASVRADPLKHSVQSDFPKRSVKSVIVTLAVIAVLTAGGLSLLASTNPDGLEWALFGNSIAGYGSNMGLDEEAYGISSEAADAAGRVLEKTSILPDYAFAGSDNPAGTSVSGLVGIVMVAAVAAGICVIGGFLRKKRHGAEKSGK